MNLGQPDWLYHRLTVDGPPADLARFRQTVSGAGVVPWAIDIQARIEDWAFALRRGCGQRISIKQARIYARSWAEAVEEEHAAALSWLGRARGCAFDLHAIRPVPGDILGLGMEAPEAIEWLWRHWGTTWPLRRVARTREDSEARFSCEFVSADWTPWPIMQLLRTRFPALKFVVRVQY